MVWDTVRYRLTLRLSLPPCTRGSRFRVGTYALRCCRAYFPVDAVHCLPPPPRFAAADHSTPSCHANCLCALCLRSGSYGTLGCYAGLRIFYVRCGCATLVLCCPRLSCVWFCCVCSSVLLGRLRHGRQVCCRTSAWVLRLDFRAIAYHYSVSVCSYYLWVLVDVPFTAPFPSTLLRCALLRHRFAGSPGFSLRVHFVHSAAILVHVPRRHITVLAAFCRSGLRWDAVRGRYRWFGLCVGLPLRYNISTVTLDGFSWRSCTRCPLHLPHYGSPYHFISVDCDIADAIYFLPAC